MKKKILALCLVVALAATAVIGGTLAYFTDTDAETNVFVVGNVDIELIESQLHRVNAGVPNGQTSTSPLWSNVEMNGTAAGYKYDENGFWTGACYTDDQIKTDAETYQDEYLADANIAPGTGYHKMPYVINTGKNDAYIRIRVIIHKDLDGLLDDSMYTGTAISSGEFTYEKVLDGNFYEYTFTRVNPLASGEMTFWNVWGSITMDKDVTNADITDAVIAGLINRETGEFNIVVEADGIQADSFANAAAAWTAFDAQ